MVDAGLLDHFVSKVDGGVALTGEGPELRNRRIRHALIVSCDGLTRFPETIEATWSQTTVQTCTGHLIRAVTRFVPYTGRRKIAAALKMIYTTLAAEAARLELDTFAASDLGNHYPTAVMT
ncbi:transposase [Amycolatopsis japonica]|uniref:transposase n=1 Tax=Amycolatopsis japonica TaxID=208439 RepID=UPI003F4D6D2D